MFLQYKQTIMQHIQKHLQKFLVVQSIEMAMKILRTRDNGQQAIPDKCTQFCLTILKLDYGMQSVQ
jgi:hypothetical protein